MIIKATVWHDGNLFTGKNHAECIQKAVKLTGIKPVKGEQGFITNNLVLLDREEAAYHAIICGQIKQLKYHKTHLFSEDLTWNESLGRFN